MKILKKSSIELIIIVLGGILLGLVVFIAVTSLSKMLALQKSSLLGIQFLEGVYLTNYFSLKNLSEEKTYVYEINTNMPITSLEIGENGFKINNFCFLIDKESNNLWKYVIGFAVIKEGSLIAGAARTKLKVLVKKTFSFSKLIKFAKTYNYFDILSYFYSRYDLLKNQKICIIDGNQFIETIGDNKIIIKKDENSKKIGENIVFKSYLDGKNKELVMKVGIN